jgi:hypothetical protein
MDHRLVRLIFATGARQLQRQLDQQSEWLPATPAVCICSSAGGRTASLDGQARDAHERLRRHRPGPEGEK